MTEPVSTTDWIAPHPATYEQTLVGDVSTLACQTCPAETRLFHEWPEPTKVTMRELVDLFAQHQREKH